MGDFGTQVAGVASLNEPVRRDLYRFVVSHDGPVSRDAASEGVGVPRHTAKFHLDRLVEDGLLTVDYQRLTNRRGPGAGRPAKLYRRADREVSVSLPERHYELAASLMAVAIETSVRDGVPVADALDAAAAQAGRGLAGARTGDLPSGPATDSSRDPSRESSRESSSDSTTDPAPQPERLTQVLEASGYEPHRRGARIELANCPFHRLAQDHTALVCGMNLALLGSLAEQVPEERLVARLDPAPDRCCVVLTPEEGDLAG